MARYTLVIGDVTDEQIGKLRGILACKPGVQDSLHGPIVRISYAQAGQMAEFFSEIHVLTKDAAATAGSFLYETRHFISEVQRCLR